MKKPIVIILVLLLILVGAGGFYATGNLENIIGKIFPEDEVEITEKENFDKILRKVKENLDKVESVHAEKKENSWIKIGDYDPNIEENTGNADFVFPDKKSISKIFSGGTYEGKTIILEKNIYIEFPWIEYAIKEEKEKNKDFQVEEFPWMSGWFHGVDGQSMPLPVPDTPGDYLTFDLSEYPKGWDFTIDVEKIEEDLGIEEINGVKCHHYKVKTKKKELPSLEEGIVLEQVENKIRYVEDGKEILFSLSNLLTLPITYKYVEQIQYDKNDFNSRYYSLTTRAIEGEIWVGEDDFMVYKENYTTEEFSIRGYRPSEPERFMKEVCRHNIEITYSNFNEDIKIEAPEKAITVEDFLISMGYPSLEAYENERALEQMQERDWQRKEDLSKIAKELGNFIGLQLKQSIPWSYPSTDNKLEKTNDDFCVLQKIVPEARFINELPVDSLDPEFYYTYKSDGNIYTLTARLENLEDENCAKENGICLYRRMGGYPMCNGRELDRGRGYFQIVSEQCIDGKAKIEVKSFMAGDWLIDSFVVKYHKDNRKGIVEFSTLNNGNYLVILDSCELRAVSTFQAVAKGGFDKGGFSVCVLNSSHF